MFTWNAESVLNAIDAGVAEVIRTYNRAYLMAWTNRLPGGASNVAMDQTVATLMVIERQANLTRIEAGIDMALLNAALEERATYPSPLDGTPIPYWDAPIN